MHHSERKRGCWRRGGGRVQGTFAVLKEPSSSCGGLEGERRNIESAGGRLNYCILAHMWTWTKTSSTNMQYRNRVGNEESARKREKPKPKRMRWL